MSTVLVVDDHTQNVFLLRKILQKGGIKKIYEAFSGEEAIDLLKSKSDEKIDLILLDVMMPAMNGFEACTEIRKIPRYEYVPVILVTAVSQDLYEQEIEVAQVNYFMMKPINGKKLIEVVSSILKD